MKSYCVSSLDSFRKDQIQTMVNTCTAHDHTSLSFPFEDASLFLFSEYDGRIVSAIAFVPVDDLLFECSAFTDPEFRGQGLFSALLDQGIQELPEDSELLFYVDQKDRNTAAVLEAIGAEQDSEEHMMELLPEDFSTAVRRTDHAESAAAPSGFLTDVQLETLDIDGTLTLCFRSGHAIVNFSVFPSHYYLYGFEVERSQRGKGYGTSFLQTVLVGLFSDTENLLTDLYTGRTVSDTPVAVSSLTGASGDHKRPVLLQVAGNNTPALALYKKTGFRITETLCCYLY